ncbi:hypothetical protein PQU92_01175 [Asticcacaulis sp. BYS171W]|uniref:Uncharacterized protein n=1 Tax=Asticcacaulis aquaticus TaxID=2984212 RepID=A0ABT5HP78_9CAUL|nr:hypothetical protein [Asticcacaulis aquaticus]MDC7681870.1 hypothetical protein [Asticcacaulis aquaticus]
MKPYLFALSIVAMSAVAPLTVHATPQVSAQASQTAPAEEKKKRSSFPWIVFLPIFIAIAVAAHKKKEAAAETPSADKEI